MSFWNGKKIMVTGGAGLIGSKLVKKLLEKKTKVIVVDDLSRGSLTNLDKFRNEIDFKQIDLQIPHSCIGLLDNVDLCFHLAAKIGGIGYFNKYPASSLHDNSQMCLNLWEEAAKIKTKMICVSSSMVFERTKKYPTPEDSIIDNPPPITGYGFSKLFSEYIAKTYWEEFGVPYVIVRPFNAYGPSEESGDYIGYSHVIPDLIKKILSQQYPLEILGSGSQTRSFTYVDDIAEAFLFVAEHSNNNDFNIGTGVETSIIELAKIIWNLAGRKEEFKTVNLPSYKYNVQRRVPDVSKIESLGWKAQIPLEQGISQVIKFHSKI